MEETQITQIIAQLFIASVMLNHSSLMKKEPQTQLESMKSEAPTPKKEPSIMDIKKKSDNFDATGQVLDALQEAEPNVANTQPHDSKNSLNQEHVAIKLVRFARLRVSAKFIEMRVRATTDPNQDSEKGADAPRAEEIPTPMSVQNRQRAVTPKSGQNRDNNEFSTQNVTRLNEQSTKFDGDVCFLSKLSDQIDLLWKCRLLDQANDENQEKVVTTVEVQEELGDLKNVVHKKLEKMSTNLNTLRENVRLIENDKDESWETISHKMSTLVEDSIGSLTDRLTELEHTIQSHRTTPVIKDDVLNMETWSTLEQVIWSEFGKLKEQAQEMPNIYTLCEELHENQKPQEKQLSGLRSFAGL